MKNVEGSLRVEEIEDFSEFESLRELWNKILQKSLDNDIFSTWEWLWYWWKHFGKGRKLRILIVKDKNQIIAIAPFMLSYYNFLNFGKLAKIEFMSSPHGDYNNFILLKKENKCVRLLLNALMDFSDWNMLDLRDIREGSATAEALYFASVSNKNSRLKLIDGTYCPSIFLPKSIDIFVKGLSRNMRRNLRKRMKRLRNEYKVEFKTQRDFSSLEEAMKAFFRLHQKRWKSKGKRGAFVSEEFRNFHLDIAKVFDEKGWLDLRFLTADDKPIAAAYTFDYNLRKYGYLTGFDPEFEKYGVGNLLKFHLVEECIKRGFVEYDLTRGFELYKAKWATVFRKNIIARLIRGGLFAKTYCWTIENNFLLWLSNKLGMHLSAEI